jgi:PAS domain S-box-containing protein
MAGVSDYDVTFRILLPGGVVKVIHSRADVDFDRAGQALRFRGTVQDITEKTWADEQLRKREEEYRALVEHSPDVVVRFDRELRCVYVNPAIASSAGLRAVIGFGRRLEEDASAAAPWARAVRRALATGCKDTFEVAVADPDQPRHYQVQVVPEFRQGGKVAAVLATARDISAIRIGEAVLRENQRRLRELSEHREHVREEERKKIAREVHDELGQALTALRMDVALLRLTDGPHSPALLARIGAMKEAVDRTIGIVRNVTSALRPAALDLGLTAALEWQVDDFARRSGIECLLHTGEVEVVLDDSQATALFRIVQESLTNVLKHAGATEVEVTLEAQADSVHLEICDNGSGFAANEPPQPGKFGLMGMRERVLMLGGTVDIHSNPGVGTCIVVRLPLTTQPGAAAPQEDE